jgi:C1A family cysteine protease
MFINTHLFLLLSTMMSVLAIDVKIYDEAALWQTYKTVFNKSYDNNTDPVRAAHFAATINQVIEHNLKYQKNATSYRVSLNKFADVDRTLKSRQLKSFNRPFTARHREDALIYGLSEKLANQLPTEFDWRAFNFKTRVRDQGDCGSCWAITVAGALEAQNFWYNRQNVELSPQELVDCSRKDHGCNGGWFESAFEYVSSKADQWLSGEVKYPYTTQQLQCDDGARRPNSCDLNEDNYQMRCTGSRQLPVDNEEALKEALIVNGPVPVALHVTSNMYMYAAGIFQDDTCVKSALNHAVLLVGYGQDEQTGLNFWTIKNSWGEDWGEDGYVRILRGANMCGVASYAVVPIIEAFKK